MSTGRHRHHLSRRAPERLARPLLKMGCWGFQRPRLKQGAAGTGHFEPGGVLF
jgi:hypothetical protein